ncbi:MAG: hypothetical protein ACRD2Y_11780, partial [Terriglobales bacterium]
MQVALLQKKEYGLDPGTSHREPQQPYPQASEALLQAAFDEAADGMAVIDGGVVVCANRKLERVLG